MFGIFLHTFDKFKKKKGLLSQFEKVFWLFMEEKYTMKNCYHTNLLEMSDY